jgi:hypothetical protein
MIKNKIVLEIEKNERKYQLELAHDSPLGEVFDILCMMKSYVIERINESQKKKQEEESPKCQSSE